MLSLVLVLSAISLIFAIRSLMKRKRKNAYDQLDSMGDGIGIDIWIASSAVILAFCLGFEFIMITDLAVRPTQIDQQIAMYQEENQKIEALVDIPELTSDELAKKQIEIYQANSAKIKELKEEKIDLSTEKFLVYFGH